MAMRMLIDEAHELSDGVWLVNLPPHEAQLLGPPKSVHGAVSVFIVDEPKFDRAERTIQLDAGRVGVLNLGTGATAVLIDAAGRAKPAHDNNEDQAPESTEGFSYGRGDREFLGLVERSLYGNAKLAAIEILESVRSRWPGDLQRGKRSNFKNTPDNFWYVIVQPRVQALSITVRGHVARFEANKLELKEDRPGYTRFSLRHPSEVPEAIKIIEQSKRK